MDLKTRIDTGDFDNKQLILIDEIIQKVKWAIENAELPNVDAQEIKKLTGKICFGIASLIDNSATIKIDGKEIIPYLTFFDGQDTLIHHGSTSFLHEYVYGVLDDVFNEK
jgi:hypothetical protein